MALTTIFGVFAGIIALSVVAVYLLGISPETKRKLQRQALNTMGENKMSYAVNDGISRIPDNGSPDLQGLKNRVSNTLGNAAQAPLGQRAGERFDESVDAATATATGTATAAPITGRDSNKPVFDAAEATIDFRQDEKLAQMKREDSLKLNSALFSMLGHEQSDWGYEEKYRDMFDDDGGAPTGAQSSC